MGVDVEIYFESEGIPSDLVLPEGMTVVPVDDDENESGATHKICGYERYYGFFYERGPWPRICGVLMSLFASTNVKRVWYFGDMNWIEDVQPITIDEVLAISRHYMLNGERPYRINAKVIE